MRDKLSITVVKLYARAYVHIKRMFHVKLRGLGFLARQIRCSYTIEVDGCRFRVDPEMASSYGVMIGGYWTEPETHAFLRKAVSAIGGPIHFVDVGCNVGEFVIEMARHSKVSRISGFDIDNRALTAASASIELLIEKKPIIELHHKGVSDKAGTASVNIEQHCGNASSLAEEGTGSVELVTLDSAIACGPEEMILLLDIEGHELTALKGAVGLIERKRPLIVLEYNAITRKHFRISELRQLLGGDYEIYKLGDNGALDDRLTDTWNIVAVHREDPAADILIGGGLRR